MINGWVNNLKIGDKVIIKAHYNSAYVDEISKITKTLLCTKKGSRFNKIHLTCPGTNWSPTRLQQYSKTKHKKIQNAATKQKLLIKIHKITFAELTIKQLQKIVIAVN